jgi:hypothetical protein
MLMAEPLYIELQHLGQGEEEETLEKEKKNRIRTACF